MPLGPWLLLGYEDVVRVLRNPAVSVGGDGVDEEALLQRVEVIVGRRPTPGPVRCSVSTRPITPASVVWSSGRSRPR